MKRWNIRTRLTLLFAALQVVVILVFSASVWWSFGRQLINAVDRNLRDKLEALAAAYELDGEGIEVDLAEHSDTTLWKDSIAQIRTAQGDIVYQNQPGQISPVPSPPLESRLGAVIPQTFSAPLQDRRRYRCAWVPDNRYGRPFVITVAVPLNRVQQEQAELLRIIALTGAVVVVLSSVFGWLVIGRLLRPLGQMSSKARQITAERLDSRLAAQNPDDEIGRLATTLNDMIERLQMSFDQIRRFTSDASHELRTPLTCMRSELEVALQQSRTPEEYREVLGSILEELERLTRLSDTLLVLARLDGGNVELQLAPVDLADLLREAADHIRVQAEARNATLRVANGPGPCRVNGDRRLLRQVLLNLLDNALKHGGREIEAATQRKDGLIVVSVHDSGPEIPADHLEHVFERFYRADTSRSRQSGGAGLGLSLAKCFVQLHGGRITVRSSSRDGTVFEITLPETPA